MEVDFWRFRNCQRRQPRSPAGGGGGGGGVRGHAPTGFFSSKIDIKICIFVPFHLEGPWIENITVKVGFLPF